MQPLPRSLSVLVPVFNEEATVLAVIRRLQELCFPLPTEIVVVDDGSTDGTRKLLLGQDGRPTRYPLRVFFHVANQGKGAAVRTAMTQARGDVLVIQDADLELDPRDILALLEPILRGESEVIYGSRFLRRDTSLHRLPAYWANRLLNGLSNVIHGIHITDFNTCYKMFTARVKDRLDLQSRGFCMEAEITAKLARMGLDIIERPVQYRPRSRDEGKKIRPRDLLAYLVAMVRYRVAALPDEAVSRDAEVLAPVAVSGRRTPDDWDVVAELREAWDSLWEPAPARPATPPPRRAEATAASSGHPLPAT